VAHFLDRPTATHMLFVDADIGFEPEQAFRLMDFDAEMTAAAYPPSRSTGPHARRHRRQSPQPAQASLGYVFEFENPAMIVAATASPSALRRDRLPDDPPHGDREALCPYPQLKYQHVNTPGDPLRQSPNRFALFECLIDTDTGVYLSEDFAFCRRWEALGGELWVDVQSKLTHTGPFTFVGDFSTQFGLPPRAEERSGVARPELARCFQKLLDGARREDRDPHASHDPGRAYTGHQREIGRQYAEGSTPCSAQKYRLLPPRLRTATAMPSKPTCQTGTRFFCRTRGRDNPSARGSSRP